ncbi:perilipin-2-like isoform X2 [Myripristis murdjan]|uniref:perilipin-2-like isoform X2 n=1 Tax=Myripristis murdjan TaxID=586833 RepID=UPI0011760B1E|nr:perilipin-2-like isoform X2 [Myripristis murdjan]
MNHHFARARNMPMNNNQRNGSAVVRLAKLPVVRSACAVLSVLYRDTKCSHPSLQSVCDVLETGVTAIGSVAYGRVSPVIIKLEPQISVANDVACKGLDWLEATFPVLQKPTEQIAASAKNKMLEVKDMASIAGNGTVDCVQHTISWMTGRKQQVTDTVRKMANDDRTDQSLVKTAISVASVGLDSALSMSEALIDQVLPPSEEDEEEESKMVRGFEAAKMRTIYPVRLVSLTVKLYRRIYHNVGAKMHTVHVWSQHTFDLVMERCCSSGLVQHLQTSWLSVTGSLHVVPQHLQHQAVCVLSFVSQMYNLSCPASQQNLPSQIRASLNAALAYLPHSSFPVQPQAMSNGQRRRRRPPKTSVFDNGCSARGYTYR